MHVYYPLKIKENLLTSEKDVLFIFNETGTHFKQCQINEQQFFVEVKTWLDGERTDVAPEWHAY